VLSSNDEKDDDKNDTATRRNGGHSRNPSRNGSSSRNQGSSKRKSYQDTRGQQNQRLYQEEATSAPQQQPPAASNRNRGSINTAATTSSPSSKRVHKIKMKDTKLYNWKTKKVEVVDSRGRKLKKSNKNNSSKANGERTNEAFPQLTPRSRAVTAGINSSNAGKQQQEQQQQGPSYSQMASKATPTTNAAQKKEMTTAEAQRIVDKKLKEMKKKGKEEKNAFSFEELAAKIKCSKMPEIIQATNDPRVTPPQPPTITVEELLRISKKRETGDDGTPSQMTNTGEDGNVAPSPSQIITVEELERTTACRETLEEGSTPSQMTSANLNHEIPCNATTLSKQINTIAVEELERNTKMHQAKDNSTPSQIKVVGDEKEEAIACLLKFCFDEEEEKENANVATETTRTTERIQNEEKRKMKTEERICYRKKIEKEILYQYVSSFTTPIDFISKRMTKDKFNLFKNCWTPLPADETFWKEWLKADDKDMTFPVLNKKENTLMLNTKETMCSNNIYRTPSRTNEEDLWRAKLNF